MTSLERVLTTLRHTEPDRVPLFLLVTMHGAKELGISIEEYWSSADHVVEGQLRLRKKYGNDLLYNLFYAPIEVEAFGATVIYRDDGPVNTGRPIVSAETIPDLEVPSVEDHPRLAEVLETTARLKQAAAGEVPVVGVVVSPFSLPVMQMGFGPYLVLMHEQPELFERLMAVNEAFCVAWANAQLAAGATAIVYFDPVSSTTIVPRETYLRTGHEIAMRTLPRIKGPTATHFGAGRCLPLVEDVCKIPTPILGVSVDDDLVALKAACAGRLTLLGNLNGIEMARWSPAQAEAVVKEAIAQAGRGGGFILSDNHGEIPWQVPEEVLLAIGAATRKWGRYPLDWLDEGPRV